MAEQLNPRFKKRMPCDLRMDGQRYPGMVINLSRGGLFVQTTLAVQPGAAVGVNLNLPQSTEPIPLQTRVVWKRVVNQRLRSVNQGGVGLEIQAISDEAEAAADEVVEIPVELETSDEGGAVEVRLSPDEIDAIANAVVARLSDQVVREIATRVVPELAAKIVRERIQELESES